MTLEEEVKLGQVRAHIWNFAAYSWGLSHAPERNPVEQITILITFERVVAGENDHLRDAEEC